MNRDSQSLMIRWLKKSSRFSSFVQKLNIINITHSYLIMQNGSYAIKQQSYCREMINKKLKNFLQLKSGHSKNSSDNTILKLKAIQRSRQKSKQKKHNNSFGSYNAYHNQSFAQTTQSTFYVQPQQKQRYNSINSQIKELQQKVDILLCQKSRQRSNTPSRKNQTGYGSRSKQRYNNSKDKITQNSSNFKNTTLRNSFLNTFDSLQQTQQQYEYEYGRQLLELKVEAAKMLSYLNLKPQQINYFDQSNNIQQLFQQMTSILNIYMNKRIKQTQQQTIHRKDRQINKLNEQSQKLKSQIKHQQSLISQMQRQRIQLKDKQLDLILKNQEQETEIYQIKLLYQQAQNNLIKVNIQHQNECEKQKKNLKLQYQTKFHKLINTIQQKDNIHTQLRLILADQSQKSHKYEINTKILLNDIQKWQRQYIRLIQHYQLQKLDKNNIQQQKMNEYNQFNEYKQMMTSGYINLVQKLHKQMNILRNNQIGLEQQIEELKNNIKQYQNRIKDIENDYLCLNDDYTRDVKEWVTKEQYYEKTIKQLRSQIFQAYQTIAQYSKMLATSAGKNSILDTTG